MRWQQYILQLGFILILLGIILLWSTGALSKGNIFIIFPFVFIGGSDTLALVLVIITSLFFIIAFHMVSSFVQSAESPSHLGVQDSFIPIGMRCIYCSKPIPIDSSFCSFCGNPIEQNDDSNNRI
jgi:hypothetical protein